MKKLVITLMILMLIDGVRHGDVSPVLRHGDVSPVLSPRRIQCRFFDEKSFLSSYEQVMSEKQVLKDEPSSVIGGILPHHLAASPMIARFLTALSEKAEPEATIVILAPNHKRIGDRPMHTGDFTWNTPFGYLEADKEMVGGLVKTLGAEVNPVLLEEEHSIAALIPFIKYSFPSASVMPVLIHGNMSRNDCKALSDFIKKEAGTKHCLILASIDFSHGLTTPESKGRDEVTKRVIEERDYDALFTLDNTHLDAPPTLAAFLMMMDSLADSGKAKGMLMEQAEASQFLRRHVPETTSYMTYIFTAPP